MIRILFLGLLVFSLSGIYCQKSVNDYKYVIVPEGYVFLGENDEYQLNSMTEFLFKKYGFTAFVGDQKLPEELQKNRCLGLSADVQKKPGLFLTKLVVELKDCYGNVIFTSSEGQSREKDFKKAYQGALRDAFKDIQQLKYKYKEPTGNQEIKVSDSGDSQPVAKQPVATRTQDNTDVAVPATVPLVKETINESKSSLPLSSVSTFMLNTQKFLFKKEHFGYELMSVKENDRRSIGRIFSTSKDNIYIVKAGDYSGIGYFDAYGNFVLERINPVTNKVIKDTFARE